LPDTVIQLNFEQLLVMTGLFLVGFVYASFFKNTRAALLFAILIWLIVGLGGHVLFDGMSWFSSRDLSSSVILILPLNIFVLSLLPDRHARSLSTVLMVVLLLGELLVMFFWQEQTHTWMTDLNASILSMMPDALQAIISSLSVVLLGLAAFIFFLRWHQTDAVMELMLSLMSCLFIAGYYQMSIYYLCMISGAGLIMLAQLYQSHRMAFVDALTGLSNRRGMETELRTLKKNYALGMLDIDLFKKINDRYGHDFGDQVLRTVATRARKSGRCRIFRYGGEEFCLVFRGGQFPMAEESSEQIRQAICATPIAIRSRFRTDKKPKGSSKGAEKVASVKVSVSIGLAMSFGPEDPARVIEIADKALYAAKKGGRNKVVARKV